MRSQRGPLPGGSERADNERAKRYVSKYTINPAITHGISHEVRSIEVGRLADLMLWKQAFFGVKPEMVLKGGQIAYALMGDPNASIPTPEPRMYRTMFGGFGSSAAHNSLTFFPLVAVEAGLPEMLDPASRAATAHSMRMISKVDMVRNSATPEIQVDPQRYVVTVDGEVVTCEPATVLPMAQQYFLF